MCNILPSTRVAARCAGAAVHTPEGGSSTSAPAAASAGDAAVKKWRTRAEAQLLALDMVGGLVWPAAAAFCGGASACKADTRVSHPHSAPPPAGRHAARQPQPRAAVLGGRNQSGLGPRSGCVPRHRQGAAGGSAGDGSSRAGGRRPGGLHYRPRHLPAGQGDVVQRWGSLGWCCGIPSPALRGGVACCVALTGVPRVQG